MKSIILTRTMLPMRVNPCGSDLLGTRGAPDEGMPDRNDADGLHNNTAKPSQAKSSISHADDVSVRAIRPLSLRKEHGFATQLVQWRPAAGTDGSCSALLCSALLCLGRCTHAARL